ncbi:MAG: AsmA-like C-terminal region-containing protein, partial [archaeon]|nr:AsmA-like C-terminal region-containing protein [archaeon]
IVTKTSLEGSAEGVSTLTNLKSLHVKGSWRANIPRRKVTLYNLSGKINNSKFIVNNFQFNTKGIKYRFNITDIDVNVNDLKPILTFLPTRLYGRVTGNISLENRLYNGTFNFKNIGYNKKAGTISNINTDIIIKNNSFYKENFQALIYSQPCLVSIATTDNNFKKIALNITAKEFHFKHNGDSFSEYKDSSNELGFKISGRIDIDNLFIEKYNFSNFSLNYSLFQRNLVIERIMSKFMGGNVNAKGNFDIFKDNPDARFSISFKKIKVHNLARLSEKYNGRLFGVATGEANFKFKISRNSSISDSLSGNMKFFIDKGKIVNTGIQKGLGIWLSELEYKLKDLEFDKIYGNFRLTGRDYYINSFLFNAPDIKLKLDGYFSRMTQDDTKLPGDIKIGLEFNKNFIKDVPNITRAFTRLSLTKRGKLYTKSFRAYGDDVTDSKNIKPL